ncbi:sensor domain-containing protein [Crassaminicella profunda]|uniref:sensor domain-containing protein n=1 Tax=Crassaminicella profunda TaxID=1286698 RepID=UPI001CA60F41|nr:bifunctional diguanylate cyclase/phosphodiesterase [Crassaminicella profunda]QZY55442.1 EAL domain-containing protein [Crassaminicella profunda]
MKDDNQIIFLKKCEDELKLRNSYFEKLFEKSPEAIAILDNHSNVLKVNEGFETLFQYKIEEVKGTNIQRVICPKSLYDEAHSMANTTENGGFFRIESKRKRKDGKILDIEIFGYPIVSDDRQVGIYAIYKDITEKKRFERKLKLFVKVLENNTEGVLIADREGNIVWINQAFTEITEYGEKEILGKNYWALNGTNDEMNKKIKNHLVKKGMWKGEILSRRKDGEIYPQNINLFIIESKEKQSYFAVIVRDITDHKIKEQKINYLAFRDFLTGLYNRAFFIGKLNYIVINACSKKEKVAVLFIDLDGFKNINDHLGHAIGDLLLQKAAKRIKSCVRECDIVARIGGDEFTILLTQMDNTENATKIAERMIYFFEKPFLVKDHKVYVDISVGIAVYPDDGMDTDTLMIHADLAMYKAKESKGNKIERFSPILNEQAKEQFILENLLKEALKRNELLLYYQPIIDMHTGKMIGAETLLRWKTKELGFVPPDKFIPIAESNGLIFSIGEWVLKNACRQNKKWQDSGNIPIYVSVNISIRQLEQKDFSDRVKNILLETGLEAKYLELEITESISAENIHNIVSIFEKLNQLGIKLSIDDFGTGYSSLSQLSRLPISKLKIDKSFVNDIHIEMNNTAIVTTIIGMAKTLKFEVVAEGIETEEQLCFLRDTKCDMGQGYLFSPPVPRNQFEEFLKKKNCFIKK